MKFRFATMALAGAVCSASAEEQHSVLTAISQTTLSGFVDTAAIWALGTPAETILFQDNFDTDTSANWDVLNGSNSGTPDFTVNWAFDYSGTTYTSNSVPFSIPMAPNSGGTTRGVKVSVNKLDEIAEAAAVNLYPRGQSFSNNYALRFDMWINYNGAEYGGSGSTEFAIFGINHSGTVANWAPPAANAGAVPSSDGVWFAITGDAGAANDYRNYEGDPAGVPLQLTGATGGFLDRDGDGVVEQEAVSTSAADYPLDVIYSRPPQETRGVPGKKWVQVEVRQQNGVLTWIMDGYAIAEKPNESLWTAGKVMIGTMDSFNSIANPGADNYIIFDNVRVVDLATNSAPPRLTLAATQPAGAEPSTSAAFTVTRAGDASAALPVTLGIRGTAIAGSDFAAVPLVTNFPAGVSALEIPITVINDQRAESTETVKLHIVANAGLYEVFAPMIGTVEIVDDGDITPIGLLALDSISLEGIEGEGAVFSVFRTGDTSTDLAVNLTVSGTATPDTDYGAIANPVTIPAGATNTLVVITALADAVQETNETVIVTLQAGEGYSVIATNHTFTVAILEAGSVLFQDDFESDTTAGYTLLFSAANGITDFRSAFNFDYTQLSIPASPRGGGTTRGLFLTVNKDDATAVGAASVNAYPKNQTFSGNYLLKFDMFLNYDPTAAGTTEHAGFGINHSGSVTNRHGAAGSDGVWFAIETDGSGSGGGRSYVSYTPADSTSAPAFEAKPASAFASAFTVPPFLAAGVPSGAWVDVSVRQMDNVVTLKIDNNVIFQKANAGPFSSGGLMLGYMDTFNSIGGTNNFVIYDNLRVLNLGGSEPEIEIVIGGIVRSGTNVQITFNAPASIAAFVVEGEVTVDGQFETEPNVQLEDISAGPGNGIWRATFPLTTPNRFFRIRQQ